MSVEVEKLLAKSTEAAVLMCIDLWHTMFVSVLDIFIYDIYIYIYVHYISNIVPLVQQQAG